MARNDVVLNFTRSGESKTITMIDSKFQQKSNATIQEDLDLR